MSINFPPLIIAASVLALVSFAVVVATTDSELESWFKNCIWGNKALEGQTEQYWNGRRRKLKLTRAVGSKLLQIIDLQHILHRFKVAVTRPSDYRYIITIMPQMWIPEYTKVYLFVYKRLRLTRTNRGTLYNRMIDNSHLSVSRGTPTRIEFQLTHSITNQSETDQPDKIRPIYISGLEGAVQQARQFLSPFSVYCLVVLDIYGDGSMLVPYNENLNDDIKRGAIRQVVPNVDDSFCFKLE